MKEKKCDKEMVECVYGCGKKNRIQEDLREGHGTIRKEYGEGKIKNNIATKHSKNTKTK